MAQSCANLLLYPQQAQQEASQYVPHHTYCLNLYIFSLLIVVAFCRRRSVSDERVMPAIASRRESACDVHQ